eukprot:COSAG04_NODE_21915_length_364_cov_1.550943_2_plen_59_part_01
MSKVACWDQSCDSVVSFENASAECGWQAGWQAESGAATSAAATSAVCRVWLKVRASKNG